MNSSSELNPSVVKNTVTIQSTAKLQHYNLCERAEKLRAMSSVKPYYQLCFDSLNAR